MRQNILLKKMISFFVFISAVFLALPSWGQTPWQLEMTLDGSESGVVMKNPVAIYFDSLNERFYITDSGNNRLLSYSNSGELIHSFNASGKLKDPLDMVKSPDGTLYVIEKGKTAITVIDLKKKSVIEKTLSYNDRNILPSHLEVHDGRLYILDKFTGNIFGLDSQLKVKDRYSCQTCAMGFSDFIIYHAALWALTNRENSVYRFNLDGSLKDEIRFGPEVNFPKSISVSPAGLLFVLDRSLGEILVYDAAGHFKYSFLSKGNRSQKLYYPIEIRFDSMGRLCVVDEGNSRVEVYSR